MEPPEALHDGIHIQPMFTPRWIFHREFAFLPHRCKDTGELIWLKQAYRAVFEEQWGHFDVEWLTQDAYVMRKLRGEA
jgi:hypothetical protein